jgi:hypothetical protein
MPCKTKQKRRKVSLSGGLIEDEKGWKDMGDEKGQK